MLKVNFNYFIQTKFKFRDILKTISKKFYTSGPDMRRVPLISYIIKKKKSSLMMMII